MSQCTFLQIIWLDLNWHFTLSVFRYVFYICVLYFVSRYHIRQLILVLQIALWSLSKYKCPSLICGTRSVDVVDIVFNIGPRFSTNRILGLSASIYLKPRHWSFQTFNIGTKFPLVTVSDCNNENTIFWYGSLMLDISRILSPVHKHH